MENFSSTPPLVENDITINDSFENITFLDSVNTSPIEIGKLIRNIKKSHQSHCGIPGKFLSLISTPVSFSMSRLFNNLFQVGHFPDIWKIAHITAIYKRSGPKTCRTSYRPISLLPTLSKTFESVLHDRLHCMENNII